MNEVASGQEVPFLKRFVVIVAIITCVVVGIPVIFAYLEFRKNNEIYAERVLQSTYSGSFDDDMLTLTAVESALPPSKVVVSPIFDIPLSDLHTEALGPPAEPFGELISVPVEGENVVRIPGVVEDVCDVSENEKRCQDYTIIELQVQVFFLEDKGRSVIAERS